MKPSKVIHKSRLIAINGHRILVLQKVGAAKKYTLPGGVPKKKETDILGLVRETLEEIGIAIREDELQFFISLNSKNRKKQKVKKHYFLFKKPLKTAFNKEPFKFSALLWVTWYDALEYLDKEDKKAVALYFNGLMQKAN